MICKTLKYKASEETVTDRILRLLPEKYARAYMGLSGYEREKLTEIRIRADSPCSFTVGGVNVLMRDTCGTVICSDISEIAEITGRVCGGSVYSMESVIRDGYIPFYGTRIGVCGIGSCVDGKYIGQRKITSLVFRIPVFTRTAADKVFNHILEYGFENTMGILAVSPPNFGKTTFLRALAARLSDTSENGLSKRVCIIDERGELYNKSMMENCLCDVISGIPKMRALEMAIRTMSPEVVIFDEIGSEEQTGLLCSAYSGGVYIAASVHGNGISDIMYGSGIRNAFKKGVFSTVYLMRENASVTDGEIIGITEKETI